LLGLQADSCIRVGFAADHGCLTHWRLVITDAGRSKWILVGHNDTVHLKAESC
jgi:hypothetical protein